ncbi:MAG: beta-N-acetylhexosaminidase [Frankiaceae bacterium]|nr:beta-N-acetylhexosaminidase [Frankiaceae bacterium]
MESIDALADACLLPPFVGTTAPEWVLRRLAGGMRGVTLFGRNVESRQQLAALTAQLRAARADVLIAIDEEGGDVTRLEYHVGSSYPGNYALGVIDDVDLTRAVAGSIGADLALVGINFDLAPVADVNSNPLNPSIGVRSFGADPALVARHVAAYVEGLQTHGVIACAKHFPGHGDTSVDSHLGLPTVTAGRDELDRVALLPFRAAIAAGVQSIMTAHIVMTAFGDEPATISSAVLTGLLRDELGYDGLVITDAVDMAAVADAYGTPGAAVRALIAGADAICVGGGDTGEEIVTEIRDAIVAAVRDGSLPAERLEEAVRRIDRAAAWAKPTDAVPAGDIGLTAARRAVAVSGAAVSDQPLSGPALVAEIRPVANIAVGTVPWGMGVVLTARDPGTSVVTLSEDETDVDALLELATGRPVVLVFRDLARHPWAQTLADAVVAARPDAICVDMGWPGALPAGARVVIAAHGGGRVNGLAVAELLLPPLVAS